MTYFEAIEIKQNLIVNLQYADLFKKTALEAVKEVAEKYTNEQFAEAYKVICAKLKEEKEDVRKLFSLAVQSRNMDLPEEAHK